MNNLNCGLTHSIPEIIYGTAWKKELTAEYVKYALDAGFTAFDTANQFKHYREKDLGIAIQQSGIDRSRLFIQTKFTPLSGHGKDYELPYDPRASICKQIEQSFIDSLDHLRTTHVDSYLMHSPLENNELTLEGWGYFEDLKNKKLAKFIGISNISASQLSDLISRAKIKPDFVQNRCLAESRWDLQVRLLCQEHNIGYQGFWLLTGNTRVTLNKLFQKIADSLNCTQQQLLYSYARHMGIIPLSGTTNLDHMREALSSTSLKLNEEERLCIDRM